MLFGLNSVVIARTPADSVCTKCDNNFFMVGSIIVCKLHNNRDENGIEKMFFEWRTMLFSPVMNSILIHKPEKKRIISKNR